MDRCALCGSSAHVYLVLGALVPVCTVHDVDSLMDDSEHIDIGRACDCIRCNARGMAPELYRESDKGVSSAHSQPWPDFRERLSHTWFL